MFGHIRKFYGEALQKITKWFCIDTKKGTGFQVQCQCTMDLLAVETRLVITVRKQLLHRGMLFNSAIAILPGHLLHIIPILPFHVS